MIEPGKLFQLEGGQKRRKLALTYGALERDIRGIAEKGTEYSFENIKRSDYLVKITEILLKDPKLEKEDFDALKVEYDKVLSENVAMRGRMDYVEELLADCEKLQEEWRNRVREAKETKIEMMNLISALSKTQFESE